MDEKEEKQKCCANLRDVYNQGWTDGFMTMFAATLLIFILTMFLFMR